jgi:hypothetical protein
MDVEVCVQITRIDQKQINVDDFSSETLTIEFYQAYLQGGGLEKNALPTKIVNYSELDTSRNPAADDKSIIHCLDRLEAEQVFIGDQTIVSEEDGKFVHISLERCDDINLCKNPWEIDEYLSDVIFNLLIFTKNYDSSNLDEPITDQVKSFRFEKTSSGGNREAPLVFFQETILKLADSQWNIFTDTQ